MLLHEMQNWSLIAYSFVLLQGVVFAIFHCLLDDEVTRHPPFIPFVFEKLSISGSLILGKVARVAKWWEHSPPSYQSGPGSNPGVDAICEVEFVVGSLPCSERFFLLVLRFSPPLKNQYFHLPVFCIYCFTYINSTAKFVVSRREYCKLRRDFPSIQSF